MLQDVEMTWEIAWVGNQSQHDITSLSFWVDLKMRVVKCEESEDSIFVKLKKWRLKIPEKFLLVKTEEWRLAVLKFDYANINIGWLDSHPLESSRPKGGKMSRLVGVQVLVYFPFSMKIYMFQIVLSRAKTCARRQKYMSDLRQVSSGKIGSFQIDTWNANK